jgi:protein disulfide-isomerase A6
MLHVGPKLTIYLGCGHCKKLKPIYAEVTKIFENESKCKVIAINGDANRDLIEKYKIKGYPNLKFFTAEDKANPVEYNESHELGDLVEFQNNRCGTFRKLDGRLMPEAGVRIDVEEKIVELLNSHLPVDADILAKEFGAEDP